VVGDGAGLRFLLVAGRTEPDGGHFGWSVGGRAGSVGVRSGTYWTRLACRTPQKLAYALRRSRGRAADGRSLAGLLQGAVVESKRSMTRGLDGGDALLNGRRWLEQALQGVITDAARDATSAEVIVRPRMGWVRVVNAPCCSRCAVLAGRFYQWHEPLRRHPQCDCLNQPTTEADSEQYVVNPKTLLDRGLITDLSQKQKARLDDGADLNRVLNESRDRWRERMAADRRAERAQSNRQQWAGAQPGPTRTVNDFMAHLTNRVDAINAMRDAGIVA
jgi:hypothetical protein